MPALRLVGVAWTLPSIMIDPILSEVAPLRKERWMLGDGV